ncbi:MAG: MATE family efflux transporter [Clostridia bacterium]|nr:MATE family efflux transporter [Clostridia bacterium]
MPELARDRAESPFESRHTLRLILKFAVPSVVAFLVQALYNIVDQIFIGQIVGFLGNAATNVAFPLTTLAIAGAVLIGDGTAAVMSLKMGAGNSREAGSTFGTGLIASIVLSLAYAAFAYFYLENLLLVFGATENVMPYAIDYTLIIVLGLPASMVTCILNSSIRVDGHPNYAMTTMLIGTAVNIVLDAWFMIGFRWGVQGAAWATVIGQVVALILNAVYIPRFKEFKVERRDFRVHWKLLRQIMLLGISSFITQIAIAIVQIVMNNQIGRYGAQSIYGTDIPLAVLGIVMKANMILISVILGLAVGSQPIWGYNYGAQNYRSVKRIYAVTAALASCVAVAGWILFQVNPDAVISWFGQEDELYNQFARRCFQIYLFGVFAAGLQITSSIFFQAIGKPGRSILLSLSRQLLFLVPLLIVLPIYYGIDGLLYSGPIADIAAAVLAIILITFEMVHLTKMQHAEPPAGQPPAGQTSAA